jgi:menaquinone-dependent protoporphyrinogen oxidase
MINVLVAFATKHHSTEQIAEMVGAVLRQETTLHVEVRPVETVVDVSAYGAVVLGSAIYAGQWLPAASAFIQKHQDTLAKRPVWIFSSGPIGEGDPRELIGDWDIPSNLRPVVENISPRNITVFNGSIDMAELSLFEQFIIKGMRAPTGDYRDWELIRQWGYQIAHELTAEQNTNRDTDYSVDWSM